MRVRTSTYRLLLPPIRTIKPLQHVAEFSGEQLAISSGKLFCDVCREAKRVNAERAARTIFETSRQQGKLEIKDKREQDRTKVLLKHNDNNNYYFHAELQNNYGCMA